MTDATLITVGTGGGPKWRSGRVGVCSALRVDGALYIVDFGYGSLRQLHLSGERLDTLRAGFVTHLHSDHIIDLPSLLLFGWYNGLSDVEERVDLYGPQGPRPRGHGDSCAPSEAGHGTTDRGVGFSLMMERILSAFSTDIDERIFDNARPEPTKLLAFHDVEQPTAHDGRGSEEAGSTEPWVVYRDDRVVVTTVLVEHAPMEPAHAFRFDTAHGSVVFSGDTGPSRALVRLARGADILVHEVIDDDWVRSAYADRPVEEQQAMVQHHLTAHTGIADVARVAEQAGAATLVLNHYVPADAEESRWTSAAAAFSGDLVVAADGDEIPM